LFECGDGLPPIGSTICFVLESGNADQCFDWVNPRTHLLG
jgi:hypothetical protein